MPILTPTIWIVLVAAALQCLTGLGWWMTSSRLDTTAARLDLCQQERRDFESRVRTTGELAKRRILIEQQKAEQITREVSHEYQARLDALRADYDRLRKRAAERAGGGGMPAISIAPARADEITADCLAVAEPAAETTLMLVELQAWVAKQGEVK